MTNAHLEKETCSITISISLHFGNHGDAANLLI